MRNAFIEELYELVKENKNVLGLAADNGAIVFDKFRKDFPENFINFGIAEANMISVAAGLASCGKIPFAYTIASFITMRAFEQVRNDICMQKMNVKLAGIGAGFVYSDLGPTHHAVEDIALMNILPNMTIFAPADPLEARKCARTATEILGPVYIRLTTGGTPKIYDSKSNFYFKAGEGTILNEGRDIAVIACGSIVYETKKAIDELVKKGISIKFINLHTLKPVDEKIIIETASNIGKILTVEEHSITGGLGSIIESVLFKHRKTNVILKKMGLNGFPDGYGKYDEMKEINGLSKNHIIQEIEGLLKIT